MRMSGFAWSDCATMSSTVNDSGLSADLPVSKITPRRMTGVRSGVNRIGHPDASTRVPCGVLGHLSLVSSTPSPSESLKRWHPTLSTSTPAGVLGHLSMPSGTPSVSESSGQPALSTMAPARAHGRRPVRPGARPRPGRAGKRGAGGETPPPPPPQRGGRAREPGAPPPAMDRVVGEAEGGGLLEVEPRITAEDVEEVAGASEIQHQARGTDGERGGRAARPRRETLIAAVELRAHHVIEEVRETAAAADLVLEIEQLVVTRHRGERPELELVRALRAEARRSAGPHRARDENDRKRAHRRRIPP